MTDLEKLRAVMEELLKSFPCCSCCSSDDEYRQLVQRIAEIAGFEIDNDVFPGLIKGET